MSVYTVPKEDSQATAQVETSKPAREVTWTAPKDWEEQPATEMRQGSFLVHGGNGAKADVSVVAFPGDAGGDVANVNRWRGQINLPEIEDSALQKTAQKIDINGTPALLVAMDEKSDGTGRKILAAILHRDDRTWFFKMMGNTPLVTAQKDEFITFLQSVRFAGESTTAAASAIPLPMVQSSSPIPPAISAKPKWKVPQGWQEQTASGMRQGSFAITEGPSKADVSVVALSGDAGGVLANVNRWRGQLSLPDITEDDLTKSATTVETTGGPAVLVDIAGETSAAGSKSPARILAAIIVRKDGTWFIKITGNDALVAKNKSALLDFLKSLEFPNHG